LKRPKLIYVRVSAFFVAEALQYWKGTAMKHAFLLSLLSVLALALTPPAFAGCTGSMPIQHTGRPGEGAFDLQGTVYEGKGTPGPALRFWAYDGFAKANNDKQNQYQKRNEWLVSPLADYGKVETPPGHWIVFQANWLGFYIEGCVQETEGKRTVVELSFPDEKTEGTARHKGFYLACSVPADRGHFMLDRIRGAGGPNGNVVPLKPIPVPKPKASRGKRNGKDKSFMDVTLELDMPESYSEKGKNDPVNLIAGLRLYYMNDEEPTSSKPEGYKPVLDPGSPDKPLGLIPFGKKSIKVAVPVPKKVTRFVSRVEYQDASAEVLSNAVSGNSEPVKAAKGGRGKRKR
jgi:hypothetical protein